MKSALEIIEGLLMWQNMMGGFDTSIWRQAEDFVQEYRARDLLPEPVLVKREVIWPEEVPTTDDCRGASVSQERPKPLWPVDQGPRYRHGRLEDEL